MGDGERIIAARTGCDRFGHLFANHQTNEQGDDAVMEAFSGTRKRHLATLTTVLALLGCCAFAASASAWVVANKVKVGGTPFGVSGDGTHIWSANRGTTVTEINAATRAIENTVTVGTTPYAVSDDGTHVWVANFGSNNVSEINQATAKVENTITVGSNPNTISSDGTRVWVTNAFSSTVTRVRPY